MTAIRTQLTGCEAESLERAFRQATDRKHLDRPQILHPAHRGRDQLDIAADLGITPRTVQRWLRADLGGGLDALRPRKAKGNARAIPALVFILPLPCPDLHRPATRSPSRHARRTRTALTPARSVEGSA